MLLGDLGGQRAAMVTKAPAGPAPDAETAIHSFCPDLYPERAVVSPAATTVPPRVTTARVRASRGAGPWAGVTPGKLAGQALEVVARAGGGLVPCGDADGERVAADTGEVLAEQVSGSRGLAGGCGDDRPWSSTAGPVTGR
jgi:hypothetical protein